MRARVPALCAAVLVALTASLVRAGEPLDMKALKVKAPEKIKGWEGEYNENLKSWTYEKYIEVEGDDIRKPNRFYVDVMPDDVPTKAKEYAEKLKTKNFQDFGYVYTEVSEATDDKEGGFLIQGLMKDHTDKDAKAEPGFVYVKKIGDTLVRVKSGTLVNDAMRKEAIELARTLSR
jgi:hypothetical protein